MEKFTQVIKIFQQGIEFHNSCIKTLEDRIADLYSSAISDDKLDELHELLNTKIAHYADKQNRCSVIASNRCREVGIYTLGDLILSMSKDDLWWIPGTGRRGRAWLKEIIKSNGLSLNTDVNRIEKEYQNRRKPEHNQI